MGLLDIFKNNAFGVNDLTESFNVKPNTYGRLQQMGLFRTKGVRSRTATIERKNFVLNILPSRPVGAPASQGTIGKRDIRQVPIPHFPHEDTILAEDVQGVRAFGTENQLQSVQELVNEKMNTMTDKHDITREYLKWGALSGFVLDADGSVLLDLFATFGVTQEVQSFDLGNSSADQAIKMLALKRYMEQHLFGDTMSGIKVMASSGWFDAFTSHALVRDAYKYFTTNQQLGGDYRTRFVWAGVDIEEHVGQATTADGDVKKFIPDDEAIAFPLGSQSFVEYFAPADFIETVNTPGLPRYAKQRIMDFDRGVIIHTQSNPLPMVLRPQLLVRLTK